MEMFLNPSQKSSGISQDIASSTVKKKQKNGTGGLMASQSAPYDVHRAKYGNS